MSEADDILKAQAAKVAAQRAKVEAGVRRVVRILEEARQEIVGEVAVSDWDRAAMPKMLHNIDQQLETWRKRMTEVTQEGQAQGFADGANQTEVLRAMNVDALLIDLPDSLLRTFQEEVGARISRVTNETKTGIDRILTTTLLTGGSREDAINGIKWTLMREPRGTRPQGRFRTIEARARFIYQHEVGRVFATAQYFRQVQAMQYVPDLKRVWRHVGHPRLPRPDHLRMHGETAGREDDFINPFTGHALRFPRDPNADIGETANCTCDVVLWRPLYGDKLEFIGRATTAVDKAA